MSKNCSLRTPKILIHNHKLSGVFGIFGMIWNFAGDETSLGKDVEQEAYKMRRDFEIQAQPSSGKDRSKAHQLCLQ